MPEARGHRSTRAADSPATRGEARSRTPDRGTLRQLVADPFRKDGIDVRLTSHLMPEERSNPGLIDLLHVDVARFAFMDGGDGGHSVSLEALVTESPSLPP